MPTLSVGTLTADMMDQASAIQTLETSGIPLYHLDVMDGQVWPKITVGAPFLAGIKTSLLKDVHLLCDKPENHIADFASAGADLISFCVEYTQDIGNTLDLITEATNANDPERGILRGTSLNPNTPLETIQPHLDKIDFVLLLAVGPDTGKETFFDSIPEKINTLRSWKSDLLICIDGAVKKDNIGDIASMEPDFIVSGSAIFDGTDPAANIQLMQQAMA